MSSSRFFSVRKCDESFFDNSKRGKGKIRVGVFDFLFKSHENFELSEKQKFLKFRMSTVGRVRPGSMRGTPASQQKIAERLTILNERAPGMMTRLYNLKNQV